MPKTAASIVASVTVLVGECLRRRLRLENNEVKLLSAVSPAEVRRFVIFFDSQMLAKTARRIRKITFV